MNASAQIDKLKFSIVHTALYAMHRDSKLDEWAHSVGEKSITLYVDDADATSSTPTKKFYGALIIYH